MKGYTWAGAVAAVLGMAVCAGAADFRVVGARALSLGGAGVARPEAAFSAYYNPAALAAQPDRTEMAATIGLTARDTGLGKHIEKLEKYDWEKAIDNPESLGAAAIILEITNLKKKDGLVLIPGGAVGFKAGSFGSGIIPTAQIVMFTDLDKVNVLPISGVPGSFENNRSGLIAEGLGLVEVPIAYAREYELGPNTKLAVGGSVKFLYGMAYGVRQYITSGWDDIRDNLTDGDKGTATFGVDAGLLLRSFEDRLAVGLLARNLNSPAFDMIGGGEIKEKAQIRTGVDYMFTKGVHAALDLDLTENEMLVGDGAPSRQLGGGVNLEAWDGMSLRAGIMKNLADSGSAIVWTLGVSLGAEYFRFDVAAALSGGISKLGGVSVPEEGGVLFSVAGGW